MAPNVYKLPAYARILSGSHFCPNFLHDLGNLFQADNMPKERLDSAVGDSLLN